jgi:exonuclease III
MNKTAGVLTHLEDKACDVCLVQETYLKLTDTAKLQEIKENGWNIYSSPRNERSGGGIGVLYRDGVVVKLAPVKYKFKTFQVQEVLVGEEDDLVRLCNIYRPPYNGKARFTEANFLDEFNDYLSDLLMKTGSPLIMGDFNFQVQDSNNFYSKKLLDLLDSFDFVQNVPLNPTHIRGGTLDLIICQRGMASKLGNLKIFPDGTMSDHYLVMVEVKLASEGGYVSRERVGVYHDFKAVDVEVFRSGLRDLCLEIPDDVTPEEALYLYDRALKEAVDRFVPTKRRKLVKNFRPWREREDVRDILRERRKAERAWEKNKTGLTKARYRELQRQFERVDKDARMEYVRKKLEDVKDDPAGLQKMLARLLGKKETLLPGGLSDKKLADNFAQFFSGKIDKIRSTVLEEQQAGGVSGEDVRGTGSGGVSGEDVRGTGRGGVSGEDVRGTGRGGVSGEDVRGTGSGGVSGEDVRGTGRGGVNGEDVRGTGSGGGSSKPDCELTQFKEISQKDLVQIVKQMSSKSCGLDPVPTWLVKDCLEELAPALTTIINKSLCRASVPEPLQRAVVMPTIKDPNGDRDLLANYRPVSNIAFVSKVLEKVVLNQMNDYLLKNDLLNANQSGYRTGHSCETLLAGMFDDLLKDLDSGKVAALMLLDMSAAFDTVDHEKLMEVLEVRFGVKGSALGWFKSYLSSRSYRVNVHGELSEVIALICGVPQGSLLGPVLFLLYIEELQDIARPYGLMIKLYADDSQLYVGLVPTDGEGWTSTKASIEECLASIKNWMVQHWLKCNESKTEFVLLGKSSSLEKLVFDPEIRFGDTVLQPMECRGKTGKTLGILLDEHLTLERQVNNVKKQCGLQLKNLWQLNKCLDNSTRILLVKQLVISKIDYCNILYFGLPKRILNNLQKVLNSCVRFIYNLRGHQDSYDEYFKEAHILPIEQRLMFKACLLAYKIVRGTAPEYLQELVPRDNDILGMRPTRANSVIDFYKLKYPKLSSVNANSKLRRRRVSVFLPTVWNSLPLDLRSVHPIELFKSKLKTRLFLEAFPPASGDSRCGV